MLSTSAKLETYWFRLRQKILLLSCLYPNAPSQALKLEAALTKISTPYSVVYDSDDEETRAIQQRLPNEWDTNDYVVELGLCSAASFLDRTTANFSDTHGWISEMMLVEELRRMENGKSCLHS